MVAASRQIDGREPAHEGRAVGAKLGELFPEAGLVAGAIAAGAGDGILIPALESTAIARPRRAPPGEAPDNRRSPGGRERSLSGILESLDP
jgi:hypothetical protein